MAMILDPSMEAAANGSPHDHSRVGATATRPSQAASHANFWRGAADKRLRRGGLPPEAAWEAYWRKRTPPTSVARLTDANGTPLAWAWGTDEASSPCAALVELADELAKHGDAAKWKKPKRRLALQDALADWLESTADGEPTADFAIGCLAAGHLLNELGGLLGAEQGWELIDFLAATADEALRWPTAEADAPADRILAQQLLAGELPLALSYFLAEMGPAPALGRAGRERLSEGLVELVDDRGFLAGAPWQAHRALAACWTRCRAIGEQLKPRAWKASSQRKFQALVRQAIRWSDSAGRQLLCDDEAAPWGDDFLAALVNFGGRKGDEDAARALLASGKRARRPQATDAALPRTSSHSEAAGLAIMRAHWSPHAGAIAVNYAQREMQLALTADGQRLLNGPWTVEPRVDGKLLQPTGEWEEVCWFSDADVDYLELVLALDDGAKLERQILLARRDHFVLLADHLQNSSAATLELSWQAPLADGLQWQPEAETRDATLATDKPIARLLPLALPEWRVDPRIGELTCSDGAVRLAQRTAGRALACPLFIDLNPRRSRKACTWRQLTVAEALAIQPPDVAVGYRAQCGDEQWLFYRSQSVCGNRTVLGQNTSNECLIARFLAPSGEIEELLEIEA